MRRRRRPTFKNFLSLMGLKLAFWVTIALVAALYIQDVGKRDQYVYAGLPRLISQNDPRQWVHVLTNPGFMVGYSELRRNPLWVAYRVKPVKKRRSLRRPSGFSTDWRTLLRVSEEDYSRSGYDRGHLAPNYVISQLYGREAQLATFRMSNIVPQKPALNREFWQRLEEIEVDFFSRRLGEIWVTTGPVFDNRPQYLPSGIEIPDAFFRLLLDIDAQKRPRVLAFLVPQNVNGSAPLDKYVTTVDRVEELTGFDFYWQLDDKTEAELESLKPDKAWRLQEVSRLPPRYKAD